MPPLPELSAWLGTVLVFLLPGLKSHVAQPEGPDQGDVRGTVTLVIRVPSTTPASGQGSTLGSVLVEGAANGNTCHDKALLRITDLTRIEKLTDKGRSPCPFDEVERGCSVQAWVSGPVTASWPVRATAEQLLILQAARGAAWK